MEIKKQIKKEKEVKKSGLKFYFIGLFAVIVITLIIFVIPATYTATEVYAKPYQDTETYSVREPYTQCDNTNMLYGVEWANNGYDCLRYECANYETYCSEKNFWGNCIEYNQRCSYDKCVKYRKNCGIKIKNKERETASFKIKLYKRDNDDNERTYIEKQNIGISGFSERKVTWNFVYYPRDSMTCSYTISDKPTKRVCETKWQDVIKEREVTKVKYAERQVIKKTTLFNIWGRNVDYYYRVD